MKICPECQTKNIHDAQKCRECVSNISFVEAMHEDESKKLHAEAIETSIDVGTATSSLMSLFLFHGRIQRSKFWITNIFLYIFIFGITAIIENIRYNSIRTSLVVYLVLTIPLIWISLVASVKRLHDLNKSGWLVLLMLVPILGFLVLLYLGIATGTSGSNRYGSDPIENAYAEFSQSVELLKEGNAAEALLVLEEAIYLASSQNQKASIYYNIAAAHQHIGNHDLAIKSLSNAVKIRSTLLKKAEKDLDFRELYSSKKFKNAING